MPIVKKIETEIGTLGIWKISESPDELSMNFDFSEKEKIEYSKIKADRRKTEYLTARLVLKEILQTKSEIDYLPTGKPILKNSRFNISISHSAELVTVLLSDCKIGIDVENTKRNIDRVAKRFLQKKEFETIQELPDPQKAKILYWSAKEAIFKCTDNIGVQFDKQIFIKPFEIAEEGTFTGFLNKTIPYKLWYFFYENNVIVFCIE